MQRNWALGSVLAEARTKCRLRPELDLALPFRFGHPNPKLQTSGISLVWTQLFGIPGKYFEDF